MSINSSVSALWLDMMDQLERLGDLPIDVLRKYADDDTGKWTRGKCLAEILDAEFSDRIEDYDD